MFKNKKNDLKDTIHYLKYIFIFFIAQIPMAMVLFGFHPIFTILFSVLVSWFMYYNYKKDSVDILSYDSKKAILYSIAFFLFAFILSGLSSLLSNSYETSDNQIIIESIISLDPISSFLSVALIAPLIEEYLFRFKIFDFIAKYEQNIYKKIKWKTKHNYAAIIITSLGFSSLHISSNLNQFMIYFLMGVGLGFVREFSGNVKYSVISHSVWNTFVFISGMLFK